MSIIKYGIVKALENRDIELRKQPIVKLSGDSDGSFHHYEILSILSKELSELYRVDNIEKLVEELERLGGTRYLDEEVAKLVLGWLGKEENRGRSKLMHINIHPDTLNLGTEIVHRLGRELEVLGVSHSSLCFEITENTLLEHPTTVGVMIEDLRELGCKIALDDFGKRMLNLSTLKILVPDYLKIDGMFVKGAVESEYDRVVIRSLVDLCKIVNTKTIAEKIETKEEFYLMRALGVDYGQGWYFSRGIGLEEEVSDSVFKSRG